jgi:hypothetical protein
VEKLRIHFRLRADVPEEETIIKWLVDMAGASGRLRIKKTIVPVLEQEARKHARRQGGSPRRGPARQRVDRRDEPSSGSDIDFEDLPPENDEEASKEPMRELYFGQP